MKTDDKTTGSATGADSLEIRAFISQLWFWIEVCKARLQIKILTFKCFILLRKFRKLSEENRYLISEHRKVLGLDGSSPVLFDELVEKGQGIETHRGGIEMKPRQPSQPTCQRVGVRWIALFAHFFRG
jgi:hypothetical protein